MKRSKRHMEWYTLIYQENVYKRGRQQISFNHSAVINLRDFKYFQTLDKPCSNLV